MNWFSAENDWLTRLIFQRGLAILFLLGFVNAVNQFKPLLGEHGLLPVPLFVKQTTFNESPSLFVFFPHDAAFTAAAWIGVALSTLAVLGISERFSTGLSMLVWTAMWVLYLSFVN